MQLGLPVGGARGYTKFNRFIRPKEDNKLCTYSYIWTNVNGIWFHKYLDLV